MVEQSLRALLGHVVPAVRKHDAVESFGHRAEQGAEAFALAAGSGDAEDGHAQRVKKANLKAARDGAALSPP